MRSLIKTAEKLVLILIIVSVMLLQNVNAHDERPCINALTGNKRTAGPYTTDKYPAFIMENVDYYFTMDNPENIDWYYVDVDETVNMEITLNCVIGFLNLNLEVYDENGHLVEGAYGLTDASWKTKMLIRHPGRYYLKIFNSSQDSSQDDSDHVRSIYEDEIKSAPSNEYNGEVVPVPAYELKTDFSP